MSKASKQRRDRHYEQLAHFQSLAADTLAAMKPRLAQCDPPVVDALPIADFAGRPDGLWIWYAFRTRADQERGLASGIPDELRRLTIQHLADHGYPTAALDSLQLHFANREDIDAAGGDFSRYVK